MFFFHLQWLLKAQLGPIFNKKKTARHAIHKLMILFLPHTFVSAERLCCEWQQFDNYPMKFELPEYTKRVISYKCLGLQALAFYLHF